MQDYKMMECIKKLSINKLINMISNLLVIFRSGGELICQCTNTAPAKNALESQCNRECPDNPSFTCGNGDDTSGDMGVFSVYITGCKYNFKKPMYFHVNFMEQKN